MNENILYIVHCIDAEGPLDEKLEDTFERVNNIFGLELNQYGGLGKNYKSRTGTLWKRKRNSENGFT